MVPAAGSAIIFFCSDDDDEVMLVGTADIEAIKVIMLLVGGERTDSFRWGFSGRLEERFIWFFGSSLN